MKSLSSRVAFAVVAVVPFIAEAGLVWSTESGWRVVGAVAVDVATEAERREVLALLDSARREEEAGNLYSALTKYNEVIDLYPNTDYEAEAHFRKGEIHYRRNQFERSFDDYSEVLRRFPQFDRHDAVVEGRYRCAMAIRRGERPYLWGWIPWFKDDEKALGYFEKTHEAGPFGPLAEWSLYEKGMWARELDKEEDALDAHERLIYRYPDSFLAPRSYIQLAELHASRVQGPHWDQGSTREALNFYKDFVDLFPAHEYAPEAQRKVVEMKDTLARNRLELGKFYYYRRNNARAAAIFLNEAVNAAPDSEAATEAQALLAKVRSNEPPPRTLTDWILGRYPRSDAGDFVDAQSQQNLDAMGFRDARKADPKPENAAASFGAEK